MIESHGAAPPNFVDKRRAESWPLPFVKLRGLIQLSLGQLIERHAHGLQSFFRVCEDIFGGTARERALIQRRISPLRLFRP